MSNDLDTMPPELIEHCRALDNYCDGDTDAASVVIMGGEKIEKAYTVIVVLRGNEHCRWLYEMLQRQNVLTKGKPIQGT
jgi:hypothetical protein